jgi:hypothetical protein
MRTVIRPNSSLAFLITEKFSTSRVRTGRFWFPFSVIASLLGPESYRPRIPPSIPIARRCSIPPPLPIPLNIFRICAYCRSS